ncbi:hypothetical protein PVAP13_8KG055820 [Panicum virgatum]|uniref:Uncharacterized protein n=1 Tax=Panicum virgatum TaxID=38727 RepID=A0A8T0PDX4_PANVG|nr:hypothetical protein PVAP13_8KG055820 [Panicum virgatum]
MEANDEGDGVQMAEVASAAEHVRPPTQTNEINARPKRKVTLFSFYKKAHEEEQNDNDMVDQNPRLEENELEEDLAPAPPKVQRLNSDASVINALY